MAKADKNATETKAVELPKPSKGDDVQLVLANGEKAKATIDSVNKNGTVDLTALVGGKEVVITSSPRDEAGIMPDSWRFEPKREEVAAASAPQA